MRISHHLEYQLPCRVKGCSGTLRLKGKECRRSLERGPEQGRVTLICNTFPKHKHSYSAPWFFKRFRILPAERLIQEQGGVVVKDGRCPFCGALQSRLPLTPGNTMQCGGQDGNLCGAVFQLLEEVIVCLGRPD